MATTQTVHAQLIQYATNGDQIIVNLKSAGSDISIDRSSNTKLPTTVTSAQTLANSLGALAFKDSLAKGDVGLGNVDNTADSAKNVKYATSAGSAGSATKSTQDSAGQQINTTYIKGISISGRTVTITKGDGTTSTQTTQDTNTWRGVQDNLTSSATDQSLSANQGKVLKGLVDGKLARTEWTAVVKGQTWSRLCKVDAKVPVAGNAFLLNVYATRNSVVYNDTFMIKTHHSSNALISKISGSKYGSVISIRAVCDTNGNCYVELKDSANSIANTATQNVNCTLLSISCGTLTKYTTFTDGSTLPTDFKEAASLTTNTNSLQGNLSWGEITGKPSTFAPSSHTHNYAGSSSAGGSANSAVKLDTATAGSATQPVYFSGGKPVATTYTLGKSVPSDAKFTDTVYSHPNSGVTAGTYRSVTVNAQGHVTGGSNPTTLAGYGITDAAAKSHTHTASQITDKIPASKIDGVLSLSNIPAAAQERVYVAADDTARLALTTSSVQNGDVVKVTSTGKMYFVVDETKLNSEAGYMVFAAGTAASVAWGNVTDKPSTFTPSSHTHNYAGSGSAGGSANSAVKLDSSAGSATQPVYFSGGKPVATTYTLGKSVPSDAKFTDTVYSHPSATAYAAGLYKITTNNLGHVTAATKVTKEDITALGIPGTDTNTDTKVTQTVVASASYTNWRTVLCGASNSASEGFTPATTTDGVFANENLTYQPSSGTLRAKVFKGSLSGNASSASTASKLAVTASITGGNSNTTGYRLLKSQTLSAWSNYRATFIVNSRHEGTGVLSVGFGCNSETVSQANAYGEIKYFGLTSSGTVISSDSFQIYISSDGKTAYLFEKYWDYSTLSITYLSGDFTVSNGTWTESIPAATYGALKANTQINVASSVSWNGITGKPSSYTPASHTHNYAGSGSAGGSANSAVKLDSSAGSATQPVYFSGGKPVATTYTLGKSVPSDAKFSDTTYSAATASANGLMSSTDKAKLDFGDIVYVSKTAPTKACIWVKLD